MNAGTVPKGLRTWFMIHFVVDMLFAIPLMIAPLATLTLFGWETIDPFTTRIVAAALFGIGIESWLGRDSGSETYLAMLNLKVIWSSAVIIGLLWSLMDGYQGELFFPLLILAIFVAFNIVWVYWRRRLRQQT
jgi:hypothetical protein